MIGIVAVDKPQGVTSRDVVNRVQRASGIRRCGHAGTLDPLATGVLVVCIGRCTRLVPYLQQAGKTYRAGFRFGVRSDTDDVEGQLEEVTNARIPSEEELEVSMKNFLGTIQQVPPRYSAVMVNGQRAYDLARKNADFELKAKSVRIDHFELEKFDTPDWSCMVKCGSGTYIRSLGRDLGEQFGCGAIMTSLVREAVGAFELQDCLSWDDLTKEQIQNSLRPPLDAVRHLTQIQVDDSERKALVCGRTISVAPGRFDGNLTAEIAIRSIEEKLVAIGIYCQDESTVKPKIVLAGNEIDC